MILRTTSSESALDVGGIGHFRSVMMVAGLEFTRITRYLLRAALTRLSAGVAVNSHTPDR